MTRWLSDENQIKRHFNRVTVLKVKRGREGLDKEALYMNSGLSVLIIQESHIPSQESSSVSSDTKGSVPPGSAK